MAILRPYQDQALADIRKAFRDQCRAPLFVLPTGGGKTVCFAAITHGAAIKGNRVLILAHRVELIDQINDALHDADVNADIICAGYERRESPVAVASVQTLIRRLKTVAPPDLIVCDEAHHVANGNTWSTIFKAWPNAKRLGVTATPVRQDGRGLGEHFDRMIIGPSVSQLIANGYLSPPRVFAPPTMDTSGLHTRLGDFVLAEAEALADKPSVTGDALAHYRQHADGKPAIVFCTSVAHADHVATQFRAGGYQAVALNGGSARDLRRMVVDDFRSGRLQVMASCDLFSEGFDSPGVHVGIMLRPTASFGLFLQQVGRCLRIAPGKREAIILDHASNVSRFGLPTDDRDWQLTYDEDKRKSKPSIASVRVCAKCFAANSARSKVCGNPGPPQCDYVFPVESRQIEERDGELEEVTAEILEKRAARMEQGRSQTLEQLEEFARRKGYKPGWAHRVYAGRLAKVAKKRMEII